MAAHSPQIVSASITGVVNGTSPFMPEGLRNPLQQGMYIDEFRFTMTTARVAGGAWYGGVPDALRIALRLGNTELTKGLIPAALLGRPRDWFAESPSVLSNFIWRLPKPMYIPRQTTISVQVQQQEDFRTATPLLMAVDAAMVGRPTLDNPKFVNVPYAAHFQGSLVTSGTTVDQSTRNDLRNPFRVPLHVNRFAATNWAVADGTDPTSSLPKLALGAPFDAPGACGANSIQLFDQDDRFGVRDVTPPGGFAALSDRSWRVDSTLASNAYFVADLSTTLSTGYSSTRQAIAMIGYRVMPITELGVSRE